MGSVERCLSAFVDVMTMYANRLDALLLTYGIDLLKLQRESGLYLKDHRIITDVDYYIGSIELAQKYIDALPKEPQPDPNNEHTADAQHLNLEPQQGKPQPTRGRGRPKETIKDKMIDDADGSKLQKIHIKICGKQGKDVSLIILACIKKGWMTKPTYTQVKNEFGNICTQQNFTKYLNGDSFTKEELEGAIKSLD